MILHSETSLGGYRIELYGTATVFDSTVQCVYGDSSVWVANGSSGIYRIDPTTNQIVATVSVASGGLSFGGGYLWSTSPTSDLLVKIDPATNAGVSTTSVGDYPLGCVYSDGLVWVSNNQSDTVSGVVASTGVVAFTTSVGNQPLGLASTGSSIWVANLGSDTVSVINPSLGSVTNTVSVGNGPRYLLADRETAFGPYNVWSSNSAFFGGTSSVQKIYEPTYSVSATVTDSINTPVGLINALGSIWVANNYSLVRIDRASNTVIQTISTTSAGFSPNAFAFDGTHLWVTTLGPYVAKVYKAGGWVRNHAWG